MCPCVHANVHANAHLPQKPYPRDRAPDTWIRLGLAFLPSDVKYPPAVRPANHPPLFKASSGTVPGARISLGPHPRSRSWPAGLSLLARLGFLHCRLYDDNYLRRELFDTSCKAVALHRLRREDDPLDDQTSRFVYIA